MIRVHAALVFASFITLSANQHFSQTSDIRALSELPLGKLLEVKNSLLTPQEVPQEPTQASSRLDGAEALPLQAKTKPLDRGGHSGYGYDDHDSKGSKIQSIFQISVTTLAFLAFGGYLLCLLVQAVRGKQSDMTTMAPMVAAFYRPRPRPPNRRRTTRRPPRSNRPASGTGYNRRPGHRKSKGQRSRREAEGTPPLEMLDLDSMYYTLIGLSEAYTKYHTVDYRYYNQTGRFFN